MDERWSGYLVLGLVLVLAGPAGARPRCSAVPRAVPAPRGVGPEQQALGLRRRVEQGNLPPGLLKDRAAVFAKAARESPDFLSAYALPPGLRRQLAADPCVEQTETVAGSLEQWQVDPLPSGGAPRAWYVLHVPDEPEARTVFAPEWLRLAPGPVTLVDVVTLDRDVYVSDAAQVRETAMSPAGSNPMNALFRTGTCQLPAVNLVRAECMSSVHENGHFGPKWSRSPKSALVPLEAPDSSSPLAVADWPYRFGGRVTDLYRDESWGKIAWPVDVKPLVTRSTATTCSPNCSELPGGCAAYGTYDLVQIVSGYEPCPWCGISPVCEAGVIHNGTWIGYGAGLIGGFPPGGEFSATVNPYDDCADPQGRSGCNGQHGAMYKMLWDLIPAAQYAFPPVVGTRYTLSPISTCAAGTHCALCYHRARADVVCVELRAPTDQWERSSESAKTYGVRVTHSAGLNPTAPWTVVAPSAVDGKRRVAVGETWRDQGQDVFTLESVAADFSTATLLWKGTPPLDDVAPAASIVGLTAGQPVTLPVTIQADVADPKMYGVVLYARYQGDAYAAPVERQQVGNGRVTFAYTGDTTKPDGTFGLWVYAYDQAGNRAVVSWIGEKRGTAGTTTTTSTVPSTTTTSTSTSSSTSTSQSTVTTSTSVSSTTVPPAGYTRASIIAAASISGPTWQGTLVAQKPDDTWEIPACCWWKYGPSPVTAPLADATEAGCPVGAYACTATIGSEAHPFTSGLVEAAAYDGAHWVFAPSLYVTVTGPGSTTTTTLLPPPTSTTSSTTSTSTTSTTSTSRTTTTAPLSTTSTSTSTVTSSTKPSTSTSTTSTTTSSRPPTTLPPTTSTTRPPACQPEGQPCQGNRECCSGHCKRARWFDPFGWVSGRVCR